VSHALPHLPGVLHTLEPALSHYGYLAVAGFVLLEDFGVPVPGETVLILGAVYAGTGRLSVWVVGILAFLAAVAGDNIGFAIGHFGGRALIERYGRYILLTRERVDRATAFFDRHGGKVIVVARFVEGLRQANGIIAGLTGMHWRRFLAFNALGAALWVGVWTCVGYFSGNNIDAIYRTAIRYEAYFGAAIGAAIVALVAHRIWRWRRRRTGSEPSGPASMRDDARVESAADHATPPDDAAPHRAPAKSKPHNATPPDHAPHHSAPAKSKPHNATPPDSTPRHAVRTERSRDCAKRPASAGEPGPADPPGRSGGAEAGSSSTGAPLEDDEPGGGACAGEIAEHTRPGGQPGGA